MLDQAGYESENQNAFVNLQFLVGPRVEAFATTMYNSGKASINSFVYDSSNIIPGTALPAGALDFPLMSASFAGFSDLDYRTITQTVGVNVRASNRVMINTMLSVGDLNDSQVYLYDTTGSRVGFYAGLNWIF
ncbi:MAG: hypothetical protein R6V57_00380 [Vicinamibacterales bacterium]